MPASTWGNDNMGEGLSVLCCVLCAVSTNDVLSSSAKKSTYSTMTICCCSWVGIGTVAGPYTEVVAVLGLL